MTSCTKVCFSGISLGLAVALLWALGACSADDPPPYNPPVKYDGGGGEGVIWTDYGKGHVDMWVAPKDKGQVLLDSSTDGSSSPGDGGGDAKPDTGGGNCPGPTGVTCKPTCTSKQICTLAKSGTCTNAFFLGGPASKTTGKTAALVQMAVAFVECYAKTADNTLCSTFDACSMTGTMTEGLFKSWMCNHAQVSDFPSAAKHKSAQDIAGCGGVLDRYNMDWQTKAIASKAKGKVCAVFKKWSYTSPWDKVLVTDCSKVK